MNFIKNNKFKDIVDILKSVHAHDVSIYQENSSYKLYNEQFSLKKRKILSDLNVKSYSNLDDCKDSNKLKPKFSGLKVNDKSKFSKINQKPDILHKSVPTPEHDKNINFKENKDSNLPKSLCCFDDKYKFISINVSKNDKYSKIYMKTIDSVFRSLSDQKYIELILKQLKIKMIDIFNKQDFYKKYEFSTKDFKKSELEDIFMTNSPITLNMLKIFANIFDTNLIYKNLNLDKSEYQYFNNFLENRATIILFEYNDKIYSILPKKSDYIRGRDMIKYLNYKKTYTEADLNKYNLDKIQNISKMKNISIKKEGKTGKINKKKDDLIREIVNSM